MEIIVKETVEEMSRSAARVVARTLNAKPNAVLGLATGSTPLGLYKELVRMHKEEGLDFSQVTTFNLDEYVGLTQNHPQSYHYFMHENLFKHINIPKQNIYIPSGTTDNYAAFCQWYEQRIRECGGIDLQLLGIGSDGHIAFNEPSPARWGRGPASRRWPGRPSRTTPASSTRSTRCRSTPSRWAWARFSKPARSSSWPTARRRRRPWPRPSRARSPA